MGVKISLPAYRKITVSLPTALVDRLGEVVPARGRSQFIARAIEEQLLIEEQVMALDETAGAWRDANHADLVTPEAIDQWVRELRSSWERPFAADAEAEHE
jgi:predicted transcriptional regulator